MKIYLENIPSEGMILEYTETRLCANDLGPQVRSILVLPRVSWQLKFLNEIVYAHISYYTWLELRCNRCLSNTPLELMEKKKLFFCSQQPLIEGKDNIQLRKDELEVIFYNNKELDLTQALLDEIILSLPMVFLCYSNCLGICPDCGHQLNKGACRCSRTREINFRFAKLVNLRLE